MEFEYTNTWILGIMYVVRKDLKTFANFVVSHDSYTKITYNEEIRNGTF